MLFRSGGAIYSTTADSGVSNSVFRNTILWADSATSAEPEIFNDSSTAVIDYSVVQSGCPFGSTCGSHLITTDPLLGTLGNYGGSTQTFLPAIGSSAIDAGDSTAGTCPTVDQRGLARSDGHCDIGAVERQSPEDVIFRDGFELF